MAANFRGPVVASGKVDFAPLSFGNTAARTTWTNDTEVPIGFLFMDTQTNQLYGKSGATAVTSLADAKS